MSLSTWPEGERPREKLLHSGAPALSDAELLALLLGTGVRGQDVLSVARQLLNRFGSLRGVLSASRENLQSQPGIGAAKYSLLQASMELARRHAMEKMRRGAVLSRPEDTRQFLHCHLRDPAREVFSCLFLDSQHALISCEDLFWGTLDGAAVYPREVVRRRYEAGCL